MTEKEQDIAILRHLENVIRKRRDTYGRALLRFGLSREEGILKICFGRIDFLRIKEPEPTEELFDYSNFVLMSFLLEVEDLLVFLNNLTMQDTIKIKEFPDVSLKGRFDRNIRFLESKSSYGYAKSNWPAMYAVFNIHDDSKGMVPDKLPAKLELPLYPNGIKAIGEFMDLRPSHPHFYCPPVVVILIPDYRVRIDKIRIGKKVRVTVESVYVSENRLVAKFYCEADSQSYHSNTIQIKNGVAEYDLPKEPTHVLVHILDTLEDESLDYARYEYGKIRDIDVVIEKTEEHLKGLVLKGETETIEFKANLGKQNEFLKTVVSFSNGSGGIIFLGVDDHAQVKGFKVEKDRITNLISSNIEPFVKVKIEETQIDSKPVILVEVPEGENKPYAHRELGVYIRRNATDRAATRTELDEIYSKRKTQTLFYL